jgi:DNA polymerase
VTPRFVASPGDIERLRDEAASCRACPLWRNATRTVFGEGPAGAALLLIGEQPGDQEDLAGRPFVGPAGKVLRKAMAEAGVDPSSAYVTNAVKHFKFEPRGKRRLHKKPNAAEIDACRFWLVAELESVAPRLIVALGASAVQSVFGRAVSIGLNRGKILKDAHGRSVLVTAHPSAILRVPDEEAKAAAYVNLVDDLRAAADFIAAPGESSGK